MLAKICTRLKKIIRFSKGKPGWDLDKLLVQRRKVQGALEEKLGATQRKNRNVQVQ
jgi:hypothetical protein